MEDRVLKYVSSGALVAVAVAVIVGVCRGRTIEVTLSVPSDAGEYENLSAGFPNPSLN